MNIAGYAALFDICDSGGDIIRRGAFADTKLPLPLLWQHDPERRIGTIDALHEDGLGLKIEATVLPQTGCAREVAAMLRDGSVNGLSFGYRVRASRSGMPGRGGKQTRELTQVELVEISLVTNPMQSGARVLRVFV